MVEGRRGGKGIGIKIRRNKGRKRRVGRLFVDGCGGGRIGGGIGGGGGVWEELKIGVDIAPSVTVPNQLLGAPLGTEVTLKCYVEAFPNTINYWVKNHRGTNDEMLLEGPKYSVREERSGYKVLMELAIKGFTEQDVGSYKCISTNSLGRADGTLRLYGLAEAAQSSGASNASGKVPGYTSSLSHILSMFLFIPVLWPR
ncbi:hypothetical protein M0804_007792 [Polistes exclamans]|nr:hypothetical protein M0804_007792 [Polistes exclamans]